MQNTLTLECYCHLVLITSLTIYLWILILYFHKWSGATVGEVSR